MVSRRKPRRDCSRLPIAWRIASRRLPFVGVWFMQFARPLGRKMAVDSPSARRVAAITDRSRNGARCVAALFKRAFSRSNVGREITGRTSCRSARSRFVVVRRKCTSSSGSRVGRRVRRNAASIKPSAMRRTQDCGDSSARNRKLGCFTANIFARRFRDRAPFLARRLPFRVRSRPLRLRRRRALPAAARAGPPLLRGHRREQDPGNVSRHAWNSAISAWTKNVRRTENPFYVSAGATSGRAAACRVIRTSRPCGSRLCAVTVPRHDSTQVFTIARPSPVPPVSRVREASTR